ncbi:MAG TPA: hypothetical protein VN520_24705 [Streptomyces sp.]|uniref:hypothetical protein n=1 Tax=Streptomyces sp. TaxID=1931 RepID=UPI002C806E3F|nr:hypothetical protein [Streptomyces sp.]HWU09538.1 hypothetical protein [Streptomyces sp.]
MTWTFTDDVEAFLEAAGAALSARPAENTLLLTVTAALRDGGPHAYGAKPPVPGWWRGAGRLGPPAVEYRTTRRAAPHPVPCRCHECLTLSRV